MKIPKALGSSSVTNIASNLELDNPEDCSQCVWGQRCRWELRGKAKLCILCWDNKQRCEPVGASGALPPLKRIMEELKDMEGALKQKQAQVVGNSLELLELNKTLKEVPEGIQGVIGGIKDQRRMDSKILGILQEIQSTMQDYMWKSTLGMRSRMESMDRDEELVGLEKEKEVLAKKVLEMEVSDTLFALDEVGQTLWE